MSELPTILAPDGVTELPCYFRWSGGMVDAHLRAETEAHWLAAAVGQELMDAVTEDGVTTYKPRPGVNIVSIGPYVKTPGTYDVDGNQLTAPVMDMRHHINLRIAEPALSAVDENGYPKWQKTVLAWMNYGVDLTNPEKNKSEDGKKLSNIELLNPLTINSPSNVFL